MNKQRIEQRVKQVAENVLKAQLRVSMLDILLGIGYLQYTPLDNWRRGQVPYLEDVTQVNLHKINTVMQCFRKWAKQNNLTAREIIYLAKTRGPKQELRFSKSSHPNIEKIYRTNYFSPLLSAKKQQNLKDNLEKPPEQVVFWIVKDSQCNQCHKKLPQGSFLYKEQQGA